MYDNFIINKIMQSLSANFSEVYFIPEYDSLIFLFSTYGVFFLKVLSH